MKLAIQILALPNIARIFVAKIQIKTCILIYLALETKGILANFQRGSSLRT